MTSIARQRGNEPGEVTAAVRSAAANVRRARSLSLRAVADRMTRSGRKITASGVQKIEAGTRRIDVDDLGALAAALGVTPADLLGNHAGTAGRTGATPTGELAVWHLQLKPISEAIERVLATYPQLDNDLILDHVAVTLAGLHRRAGAQQTALDLLGDRFARAWSEGARNAAELVRYLRREGD